MAIASLKIASSAAVASLGAVAADVPASVPSCMFADDVTYGVGAFPISVAIGDLDGDLDLDLAVANFFSDDVSVLLNRSTSPPCPADIDGSCVVDASDLDALLAAWGPCGGCPEDVDGSGVVDTGDLLVLLAQWGPCTYEESSS